ncbi:MAG: bifunctional transaldolase/phosoglucose isomerase [Actinomycetota bacterium]
MTELRRSLPPGMDDAVNATLQRCDDDALVSRMWARDASVWTGKGEEAWLGWLDVGAERADRFAELVDAVRAAGFVDAVVLGMGGSSLCPDVLAATFPSTAGFPRLHVLDSTDPQQVKTIEDRVTLADTLFFVSSKSGTTLEPNIFAAYFFERMRQLVGDAQAGSHFIAITDPGSPLEDLARRHRYRAVFAGVPSIGGRYSALSDFGMVPGAAAGIDVTALLTSAGAMARACAPSVPADENPGLELGAIIGACVDAGRDKLTFVASPGVARLGGWLEQLLAESTGKQGRGVIPVDGEPLGTPEVYGYDRLFAYIRLATDDDGLDATLDALEKAGQPVVRIELSDPHELGGEFFRWEFATAIAGSLIGINPFDQPDVEEAKVLARQITDRYDETGALSAQTPFSETGGLRLYADDANHEELITMAGEDAGVSAYLNAHLARAGAGDYVALLAYIEMTPGNETLLNEIRALVRDARRVATCVGFGPRFQHSTGQAYKGGPNTGVFLQITCDDVVDLPVPGHRYSFGVVKEAEARSDLDVLSTRGRRVLRLHLGMDVRAGLEHLRDGVEQLARVR